MKKLLKSDFESFKKHIREASHVCARCGRVSNDKKLLCRPERLS